MMPNFFDAIELTARGLLINALRQTQGNKKAAAKLLGMKRTTLIERVHQHGITPADWSGEGLRILADRMWSRPASVVWDLPMIRAEQLRAQKYINSLDFFANALQEENAAAEDRCPKNIIFEPDDDELDEQNNGHSNGLNMPD